jgi:hypothetical protein
LPDSACRARRPARVLQAMPRASGMQKVLTATFSELCNPVQRVAQALHGGSGRRGREAI